MPPPALAGESVGRPRILHVVTAMGIGGVEVWLIALLEKIRQRESLGMPVEEFDILLTGGEVSVLDERARELGATLHYIRFGRREFRAFAAEFRKLLKARQYTVLHDQQDYSGAWRLLAGAGCLPRLRILHVHNPPVSLRVNTDTPARKALFRVARQIVKRLATHVLGTSSQVLREYGFNQREFPRQVIRTLHCGFDTDAFKASHGVANRSVCSELGWPEGSRICVFAGRLEGFIPGDRDWNHKNPLFALETVRAAISAGADLRFIVAGDGETMREKLEALAREWNIADRTRFVGKRFDMPRLMAASHVCLFPSLEEGLGMAAVEAQAAGLRVLASDTVPREAEVLPELVTFLPLERGPDAWGAELARLIGLPRFDSVACARAVSESPFSIDASYASLHALYRVEALA